MYSHSRPSRPDTQKESSHRDGNETAWSERVNKESVIDAIGVLLLLKETAPAGGGRFDQSGSSLLVFNVRKGTKPLEDRFKFT